MRWMLVLIFAAFLSLTLVGQNNGIGQSFAVEVSRTPQFPSCSGSNPDSLEACRKIETTHFIRSTIMAPLWPDDEFMRSTSYVRYQIDPQGNVQNAEIIRSGGQQLDEAALIAVNKLPQHTPYFPEKEGEWMTFITPVRGGAHCIRKR